MPIFHYWMGTRLNTYPLEGSFMRFVKTREEEPTIGIAPLVDIVFLLLIFFMVTSHFDIASGVKISLPEVAQKMINGEDNNKITLVIDQSSETYLEGEKISILFEIKEGENSNPPDHHRDRSEYP